MGISSGQIRIQVYLDTSLSGCIFIQPCKQSGTMPLRAIGGSGDEIIHIEKTTPREVLSESKSCHTNHLIIMAAHG